MHIGGPEEGAEPPFLRAIGLAYEGEGVLPYEVELGLMARRFGVSPGQLEDEEDALLFCASEGMTILDALAARDRFLQTKVHSAVSAEQLKLIQRVEEAMGDVRRPSYVEDYSEGELAAMGIKVEG